MWNNQNQNPGFPSTPGFPQASPGAYPPPPGTPPGGFGGGYAPAYGTPPPPGYGMPQGGPQGYAPPPGPPPFGFPGAPQQGYAPPPGPPPGQASRGFPGAAYRAGNHQPPSGPPPGQQAYSPGYQPSYQPPRPPPSDVQYGPRFQGADHREHQLHFQYSQCNGKKKALLIGINYFGQEGELRGCINDVKNVKNFLINLWGYKEADMVILTDDQTNPRMKPTTANIKQAMQWLTAGARPNDALFFHYSGHGGQTKDHDGDEGDGYDEVIYPVDFEQNGHIVDDEMHDLMVKPLPEGCRLTAIFDSCHSGSALDLPYIYSTEGKLKEPNLAAEAGQGLLSAVTSYARGDMGGVFKSAMSLVKTATGSSSKADKISKATRTSPADVISFSGCKDSQTSADAVEAGQATGAMSYAFISTLTENKQQSYQQLLVNVREILRAKYSQKPQLSSSHPMDTSILFIC